ncbi:glycosyltransferase family 9 protein [Azospirillum argentinense]
MPATDRAGSPSLAVFTHGELIGDALIKIPFVRALRGLFPDHRITWITTEGTHLATTLRPMMDGLIDEFRADTGIGRSPLGLLKPMPIRERFSMVLDTQALPWRTLLARRLKHDVFVSACAGYRLSDRRPAPGYVRPKHVLDRLFDLLEVAGGRRPPLDMAVPIPTEAEAEARAVLPDGPGYVAIAPGAGKRVKCWPLERFVELARAQAAGGRVPVFILGPAELDWLPELRAAVPQALFPLQDAELAEPRYSPVRTIALTRRCAAAVANDSGTSHLFGLADVPLLTLYGPTTAEKLRPKVTRGAVLTASTFGGQEMERIPADAAIKEVEALIGS